MRSRLLAIAFLLLAVSGVQGAPDDAPGWVTQAASMKVPTYEKDTKAVVLVDEQIKTVDPDGKTVQVTNYAIRILQRDGRAYAAGAVGYNPNVAKVKDFQAWLVRPSGQVKRYGKDEIVDVASDIDEMYSEYRSKRISASEDADTGMVFAFSHTVEDKSVFSQDTWTFQNDIPVISSRFTLNLPTGWKAEAVTFNHPTIEPKLSGTSYSWELANLPPLADEPLSPSIANLAARLGVSYFPVSGQASNVKTFNSWGQVATWMSELSDPQVQVDDALGRKAYELTALAKTELEKIQAIGTYVQNLRYVSIQTGLGRGGGYRPHSSTEVFAKSYGDCKDKANLMRAMLKVVGISALPVSIYSGDPAFVRTAWPSPGQFNHCIIAVKVSDQTKTGTILEHPTLGRYLIFDPTDSETPVGDLPTYLQGSLALLSSKEVNELSTMPTTSPEMNHLERQATLELSADGGIAGKILEEAKGQTAVKFRTEFKRLTKPEYNGMVERWVTSGATAARLTKIEPSDFVADGRFTLDVEFSAHQYGQLMQQRLLIFKPAVVSRREGLSLTAAKREYPVVLRANAYSEVVTVKLPVGFAVDEVPDAVKLETPFGSYITSYEVKDGALVFKRKLSQKAATIPVDQYESVRKFFEAIRAADNAPVVLAKK